MAILKKIKLFFLFDKKTKLLFVEALFFLGWARVLKFFRFSKISHALGEQMRETSYQIDNTKLIVLRSVSQAVNIMSRYTFWESMCLVKAIAAMKMLERRHIESTLYLGTGKDENGKLIAHAWLRSGSFYITGAEEMQRFVVVSKFAKKISH